MLHETNSFKNEKLAASFFDAYRKSLSLWDVTFESRYVATHYGSTHVFVFGPEDGAPLILLHGFGFSSTMWYPNVKALAKKHRVYAIDVIGEFNRSIANFHFRKKLDYAGWLQEVMDGLNLLKASFIGHSNGGWHALNFAMHAPERVERLILLAPAASFASFSLQFPIRLLAVNLIRTRSVIVHFFGKWFVGKGNRVSERLFEQFYRGIKGFAWKHKILIPTVFTDEELAHITMPSLMLIGEREVIYNVNKVIKRAKRTIPHLQVAVIAGAGHVLSIEKADEVNRHIEQFLEQTHIPRFRVSV